MLPGIGKLRPASRARLMAVLGVIGLSVGITPAQAHHAFAAEYDADQPIDLRGVVTKARWVNPHSWLYFDVTGSDGSVTNWGVEFGAPNSLEGEGLKKADLQPGTPVHITGYRSKNGGAYGYSVTLTLADGRTFKTGGAQDAPGARGAGASGTGGNAGGASP